MYHRLKEEVISDPLLGKCPEEGRKWMEEMMDYTILGGKVILTGSDVMHDRMMCRWGI